MGVSPLGRDRVWETNLAARVAWMSFLGDLTQSEIGKRLGLSPARVHRLILLAKKLGMVRITIEGRPSECLNLESSLAGRFGLVSCTVSPYMRQEGEAEAGIATAAVGQTAGQVIGQFLQINSTRSAAFGSGRTVIAAVNALPRLQRSDLEIYAINGSLTDELAISANDVVPLVADRTGGKAFILPVPCFARSENERRMYLEQASVSAVRESAARADVFMSGVGALDCPSSSELSGSLSESERNELIKSGAVAEFAGRFLDASGRNVELCGLHCLSAQIQFDSGSARSFAAASGERNAGATLAVLRSGMITDLVVDEALAEAICASPETAQGR